MLCIETYGRSKTESPLFQADPFALADDDMVKDFDVQQLASVPDRAGERNIFRAGGRIAAWMIVQDDNSGGVPLDGWFK